MSWQIINVEPAFGVCDQCKKHDCGIIDGEHKWIMTGIYDQSGDAIVIGYRCVELWANNLGISREVVEQTVLLTPTDEQIGDYVRKAVITTRDIQSAGMTHRVTSYAIPNEPEHPHAILLMDRDELKAWFKEREIPFTPQWGEDRLREEALKHV